MTSSVPAIPSAASRPTVVTPVIIPFKYPSIKDVEPTPGKIVPGANA